VKIRVRLFAVARQLVGAETTELELAGPATVRDVRTALASQHPQLAALARHLLFAINAEYAADETPVEDQADVACIPPVSGG
jgi:molybdopterin converting factor subunit 1